LVILRSIGYFKINLFRAPSYYGFAPIHLDCNREDVFSGCKISKQEIVLRTPRAATAFAHYFFPFRPIYTRRRMASVRVTSIATA
jgi:hypothetical protein